MSLLSFRSVCINVLLNSGIGAEFFMTCTFGIGMLYSDISLFTYVQIVVYFLNPQLTEKNACIFYRWGPLDPNYVIFEKSLDYLQIYFSLVQMP